MSQGNHSSRWISGSESGLDAWTIEHVVETGSTNDDLMERARSGAPDRLVLVADHQTAGRGRLDRRWESPRGANVLMSMLFRRERTGDLARMTRVVAIAAARAAHAVSGVDVRLKWPNDLVVGEFVRVTFADASECVGTARDVDEHGHLIVDDGIAMRVIDVGDVVHLRRVT